VTSKEKEKWDSLKYLPFPPYVPGAENSPHGDIYQALSPSG
jgi:hypothetical protein